MCEKIQGTYFKISALYFSPFQTSILQQLTKPGKSALKREPETGKSARFIMTENADTAALFFCNFARKQNVRT